MSVFLTVLAVIGIVLVCVIGLVLLAVIILQFFKAKAYVSYSEERGFSLSVALGFVKFQLYPKKTKSGKANSENKTEQAAKVSVEKIAEAVVDEVKVEKKEDKGFVARLKALVFDDYIEILKKARKHLLSRIYFDRLHLFISVGSPDAAETALMYGRLNAAVFPIVGLLDANKKIKVGNVRIVPDFTAEKTSAILDAEVYFRIYRAAIAAVDIYLYIIKTSRRKK